MLCRLSPYFLGCWYPKKTTTFGSKRWSRGKPLQDTRLLVPSPQELSSANQPWLAGEFHVEFDGFPIEMAMVRGFPSPPRLTTGKPMNISVIIFPLHFHYIANFLVEDTSLSTLVPLLFPLQFHYISIIISVYFTFLIHANTPSATPKRLWTPPSHQGHIQHPALFHGEGYLAPGE